MNTPTDQLEGQGSVRFRVAGHGPQWPEVCVVCGQACGEYRELYSTAEVGSGRSSRTVRGIRSFQVPVHATAKDCYRKLLHPAPLWALAIPFLTGAGGGAVMAAIAKPDWGSRIGAFLAFGGIAFFLGYVPRVFMFRPALAFRELGGVDYIADFQDETYAKRFAELNRDVVQPWQAIPWDISINLFPKRKKRG